jgi:crotonobetaine/carnitine-CoA ligase
VALDSLPAGAEADAAALAAFDEGIAALGVDDVSTIICTSGSTAAPKPIVISHGNIAFAVSTSWTIYACGDGDVGLTVFPWAHSNGHINQLLTWLALGVRIVVADRFTASGFPDQLRRFQPDIAPLNTTHRKMVMAKLPDGVTEVESRLRIVPTALEMDAESATRFARIFGARLRKVWYQTETIAPATVVDLVPPHNTVNDNPLGHPGLAHDLRLLDDDGEPVGPGEVGEIFVRARTRHAIAVGRIDPDTHEVIEYDRDGWWATGDLAIAEPDGFLFYAGRTKEMVKRAGHNVALPEVNEVIRAHPAVVDAFTFGVPDPMREERIIAAVAFSGEDASEEVLEWCRARLADYKVPSDVVVYERIPTTELGKIDMKGMRDGYLATMEPAG